MSAGFAGQTPPSPRFRRVRGVLRRIRGCQPHDRYLLEELILSGLRARPDVRRMLFVGCAEYTQHYPALFSDREFVTIDVDPGQARYGAANHIVDSLANVNLHLRPGSVDVVLCNGVIGWGLDGREEIEQAVAGCFQCLRPGGLLIVGWNDIEPWRPIPFEEIKSFQDFEPTLFAPFPTPTYPTLGELRHVFSFFARPNAKADG